MWPRKSPQFRPKGSWIIHDELPLPPRTKTFSVSLSFEVHSQVIAPWLREHSLMLDHDNSKAENTKRSLLSWRAPTPPHPPRHHRQRWFSKQLLRWTANGWFFNALKMSYFQTRHWRKWELWTAIMLLYAYKLSLSRSLLMKSKLTMTACRKNDGLHMRAKGHHKCFHPNIVTGDAHHCYLNIYYNLLYHIIFPIAAKQSNIKCPVHIIKWMFLASSDDEVSNLDMFLHELWIYPKRIQLD